MINILNATNYSLRKFRPKSYTFFRECIPYFTSLHLCLSIDRCEASNEKRDGGRVVEARGLHNCGDNLNVWNYYTTQGLGLTTFGLDIYTGAARLLQAGLNRARPEA